MASPSGHSLTLAALCDTIVDCEHKTAPTQTEGYPSIRTPNIGRGRLLLDGVNRVSEETYREWTRRTEPQEGDLIMAREAPVGNVAVVPLRLKVCLGQRTVLIRPNRTVVEPTYLAHLLLGREVQGHILGRINGATVGHLNVADIRALPVPPVPPLPVQRRIASVITAYDDLIENNTKRIKILEEMARSLYREWFVNFRFPGHEKVKLVNSPLGRIPAEWTASTLGGYAEIVMGQAPDSAYYNETGDGLPFHQGVTNFGKHFPQDAAWCTAEARQATAGDVLFSVRAPVGRLNLARARMVIGRGLSAIRPPTNRRAFTYGQLSERVKEDSMGGGTIFKAVTKDDVHKIGWLVPPGSLVNQFESIASILWRQIEVLTDKLDNLRATRDLLLPRLISGEIDVSSLPLEPAAS